MPPPQGAIDPTDLLEKMLENSVNHDVVFKTSDGEVTANRAVLVEATPVFASMLSGKMSEASTGHIDMPTSNSASLRVFLRLIYTGHVNSKDWRTGKTSESESEDVPHEILFEVAELSRKYMTECVHNDVLSAIKARMKTALFRTAKAVMSDRPVDTWVTVGQVHVWRQAEKACPYNVIKRKGELVHGWRVVGCEPREGWMQLAHEPGYLPVFQEDLGSGVKLENADLGTFQKIYLSALRFNDRAICTYASVLATKSLSLKRAFDEKSLDPEVQAALGVLWDAEPEKPSVKRARLQ